jgi:hypothetical protein
MQPAGARVVKEVVDFVRPPGSPYVHPQLTGKQFRRRLICDRSGCRKTPL